VSDHPAVAIKGVSKRFKGGTTALEAFSIPYTVRPRNEIPSTPVAAVPSEPATDTSPEIPRRDVPAAMLMRLIALVSPTQVAPPGPERHLEPP